MTHCVAHLMFAGLTYWYN